MREAPMSPGAAAACGRLDELSRAVGAELGGWMVRTARRLAAEAGRRRTPPSPVPGRRSSARSRR